MTFLSFINIKTKEETFFQILVAFSEYLYLESNVQKSRKCTSRKYFNPLWVLSILESLETAAHKVCALKHLEKVRPFRLSVAAGSLIMHNL